MEKFLKPAFFTDSDSQQLNEYALSICDGELSAREKAVRLYYAVRDNFRYDPYRIPNDREQYRASSVLAAGFGFCVTKAVLLAALARSQMIPARLGFADVRNHLTSPRLRAAMQTDIFYFHGYAELLLEGHWRKATPAFNLSLCRRFNIRPLEFDGLSDSIFHPYDVRGEKHMEYLHYYGQFADLPYDLMTSIYREKYPKLSNGPLRGDFEKEGAAKA